MGTETKCTCFCHLPEALGIGPRSPEERLLCILERESQARHCGTCPLGLNINSVCLCGSQVRMSVLLSSLLFYWVAQNMLCLLKRFQPPLPCTHKRQSLKGRVTHVSPDRAGKLRAGEAPSSPRRVTDGAVHLLSPAGLPPVLGQRELGGEAGSGLGAGAQRHLQWILEGPSHPAPVGRW